MEAPLQAELLELLLILQNLSAAQLSGFLSFVRHGAPRIDLIALTALCRQLNSDQLERLATAALHEQPLERVAVELQLQNLSFDLYKSFASLLRLLQLHELLSNLSEMQLMKIIEMIPQQYDQVMQIQLMQQLQEFLDQLLPQTLQSLQRQLEVRSLDLVCTPFPFLTFSLGSRAWSREGSLDSASRVASRAFPPVSAGYGDASARVGRAAEAAAVPAQVTSGPADANASAPEALCVRRTADARVSDEPSRACPRVWT
jgi:hypothetical protein